MPEPTIDLTDIQGNVLLGYGFPFARYSFLEITEGGAARRTLLDLIPLITSSEWWTERTPEMVTNIAFTWKALVKLGLPAESLAGFPFEFQAGMRARADFLNDVCRNAPEKWDEVWQTGRVDIWLSIDAQSDASRTQRFDEIMALLKRHGGIKLLASQDAAALVIDGRPTSKEHFGYSDGIGNPDIRGTGIPQRPGRGKPLPGGRWAPLETGEFVLGYPDEAGEDPAAPEPHLLSRNGTYLVYRKLHQNVATFRAFLDRESRNFPGGKELLAAKLVGRWDDGTPLALSPNGKNPELARDENRNNDFSYDDDLEGRTVPLGAHIRRMNPREAFGIASQLAVRHRLARRGLPYGPWCPYGEAADDDGEHGVIFLIIGASIRRQFEFVWKEWANYGNDFLQGNDRDPITGNHTGTGQMVIQGDPASPTTAPGRVCANLPQFVEVRGGEYFFVPSLTALRLIAEGRVAEHLSSYVPASLPPRPDPRDVPRLPPLPAPEPLPPDDLQESFFRWFVRLPVRTLQTVLHPLIAAAKQWAQAHPRFVFWLLRTFKPVLIRNGTATVARYADVLEVLQSDHIFHVTYADKMRQVTRGGKFFLGMQPSPEYTRDVSNMRSVVRAEDIRQRLIPEIARTAEAIVAGARGSLDVVNELGLVVPTRVIGRYFGIPGTSERELAEQASLMFRFIFIPDNPPEVDQRALAAGAKAISYIDAVLAARKAHPPDIDDVLGRCLKLQAEGVPGMDDVSIRNNLIGLITGAIPTTSKCVAQALDQLLDRPEALAGARAAALHDDDELLGRYVVEALRFNPNNPGLIRVAAVDHVLGQGTFHATRVPRGMTVVALTQSAMFDSRVVDSPTDFRIDRPADSYVHFGAGMHECFGESINRVQIPGILQPLLSRRNLRRAEGDPGKLQMAGPFPSSLHVEFDA